MKCNEFNKLIDQYYEKDLSGNKIVDIESHLEICGICRGRYEKYVSLVEKVKKLPDQIQPTYNLWPVIREQIDEDEKPQKKFIFKMNHIAAIAAVFIFVFFSLSMIYLISSRKDAYDINVVMKEFNSASKEYLKAKEELLRSLTLKESALSNETIYEIESNIKTIDNAIDEIKLAIKSDPSNNRLVFNLADTYNKETTLLLKTKELIANIKE